MKLRVASTPVVLLGTAPAEKGAPAFFPTSGSARRFGDLCDLHPSELWIYFGLDNLVPYPEPSRQALGEAGELYHFLPGYSYLLAGSEVVRALGWRARCARDGKSRVEWYEPPPLEWYESREGFRMALLPHPSGRNRWYNVRAQKRRAETFLRDLVSRVRPAWKPVGAKFAEMQRAREALRVSQGRRKDARG